MQRSVWSSILISAIAWPNDAHVNQRDDFLAPKIVTRLFERPGIGTGKRHNAACGPADYARVVARAGLDNLTIKSTTKRMRRENEAAASKYGSGARNAKRIMRPDHARSAARAAGAGDTP